MNEIHEAMQNVKDPTYPHDNIHQAIVRKVLRRWRQRERRRGVPEGRLSRERLSDLTRNVLWEAIEHTNDLDMNDPLFPIFVDRLILTLTPEQRQRVMEDLGN